MKDIARRVTNMARTSVSVDAALTVVPEADEIFGTLRFDISFVFEGYIDIGDKWMLVTLSW